MEDICEKIMKLILKETGMPLLEEERKAWQQESEENLRASVIYDVAKMLKNN